MAQKLSLTYSVIKIHLFNGSVAEVKTFSAVISNDKDTATLSVAECRKHLKDINLSDKQIIELRDSLCVLVDIALDNHFNKPRIDYAHATDIEK